MTHSSINRTARLAGGLYLAMMPFGFFGIMYVPTLLVVPGDPAATADNITASEWLFRSGIVSHLITAVLFVLVVLLLYRLLEPVNRHHAVLMAVFALLGVPIAMLNEVHHLAVLQVLTGPAEGAFSSAQIHTQVASLLGMRASGILLTQIFWGLWLLPLGWLVFRSGFLPRLLGILLVIAGLGYVFDSGTQVLAPGFATVSHVTFVGELLIALWLLIKGVDRERWRELTRRPAASSP